MDGAVSERLDAEQRSGPLDSNFGEGVMVLTHPETGSKVVIVGTAHLSAKSAQQAADVILRTGPRAVVLEVDEEHMRWVKQAAAGRADDYGMSRYAGGWLKAARVFASGNILEYAQGIMWVVVGALLGVHQNADMVAALRAAETVSADVVAGDRDAQLTAQRLVLATLRTMRARRAALPDPRDAEAPPLDGGGDSARNAGSSRGGGAGERNGSGGGGGGGRNEAGWAGDPAGSSSAAREPQGAGQMVQEAETWGLDQPASSTVRDARREGAAAAAAKWEEVLRRGGCPNAPEVLDAFKRIVVKGMSSSGQLSPMDVLTVRGCGRNLVESYRREALNEAGGSSPLKRLEGEMLAELQSAQGVPVSRAAIESVLVRERDVILARRLWDAARDAGGLPVVGVVGAAHLPGIRALWPAVGSDEAADAAAALAEPLQSAQAAGPIRYATPLLSAGLLGLFAWRRPRAAATVGGLAAIVVGPYAAWGTYSLRKWERFAERVVGAARTLPGGEAGDVAGEWQ